MAQQIQELAAPQQFNAQSVPLAAAAYSASVDIPGPTTPNQIFVLTSGVGYGFDPTGVSFGTNAGAPIQFGISIVPNGQNPINDGQLIDSGSLDIPGRGIIIPTLWYFGTGGGNAVGQVVLNGHDAVTCPYSYMIRIWFGTPNVTSGNLQHGIGTQITAILMVRRLQICCQP